MVAKVKVLPYQCEVCLKTYTTEKQAEKCESSHEVTKQKQLKEENERTKLRDRLIELRITCETFEELQEKALVELKAWYGDDFVLELPHCYSGWYGASGARCTYVPLKKPKKTDYFNRWGSGSDIDSCSILKTLGFHTGCGSGDGKIYSYQVSHNIDDFPVMYVKKLERQRAVEDAKIAFKRKAEDYLAKVKQDGHVDEFNNQQEALQAQIDDLQSKLDGSVEKKQQYIKDVYYNYYEQECNAILAELPQQFKREHPDPYTYPYFYQGV